MIALGVAITAALLAVVALLTAYRHPFRAAVRRQNEAIEDLSRGIERWKSEYDEELEKAKKRYRESARIYRDIVDAQHSGDEEGEPEEQNENVPADDGRGGAQGGMRRVPPSVVAAGIWQGGRTG